MTLAEIQSDAERLLRELTSIDSTTSNAVGVDAVQELVARELRTLGFDIEWHTQANPTDSTERGARFLEAKRFGSTSRTITFVSHADTVVSNTQAGPLKIDPTNGIAMGAGIIDNKGGLVVAVTGLRAFLSLPSAHSNSSKLSFQFLSSPNEETGSTGFHDLYRNAAKTSAYVLGFEPALDDGSIIESRRGNRWYHITIKGRAAHAGRCTGEEINAAHDAGRKIALLSQLTDHAAGTSVNVGSLRSGRDAYNVVCDKVEIKLDTRFASFASRNELHDKIERILLESQVQSNSGDKTESVYEIVDDCPPFSATKESQLAVQRYIKIIESLENRSIRAHRAGGAGDVNYMSREGVTVLDGLGPVGGGMHTTKEFVTLSTLGTRSKALAEFLQFCAT